MKTLPEFVKMVEVGPRDGLQNEIAYVPSEVKIEFIDRLSQTGLSTIEVTSFVSPKKIPQLADHDAVYQGIQKVAGINYPALVPNMRGLENALAVGAKEIAIFGSVSETFCQKNINCSISESIQRFIEVTQAAKQHNLKIRGYISCVLGCPYEGKTSATKVVNLAQRFLDLGCYEVSLGDTIGIGSPGSTQKLLDTITRKVEPQSIAMHFHDTYGQALANIYVALEYGITTFDSSVSGLGGCPYAKGASGNVASEDVLYMLNGLGIQTNVNLDKLISAGQYISDYLERKNESKVARVLLK